MTTHYYHRRCFFTCLAVVLLASVVMMASGILSARADTTASSTQDVNALISAKNQELQQINQQIAQNQSQLMQAQQQKQTLSSQLSQINAEINQIDLGIQSSKITIDTLGLQIEQLQSSIAQGRSDVAQKQEAVKKVLQQMQEAEGDTPLMILLKDQTISDSVMAIQSLQDVNNKLLTSINDLLNTQQQLTAAVAQASEIKQSKEQEYQNLNNKKIIASQLSQEKQQFLAQTKNQEKLYQASLAALQQRQLEIASEIDSLEAPLREKINFKSLPKFVPGLLAMPLKTFIMTQGYGSTAFAKGAYKTSHWHNGVDLAAPIGTPIYAAADGIVLAATNQDVYCPHGAYGKYVAIKHLNGLTTLYGHMSLIVVTKNQSVKRGDLIGYVGRTGFATGPHLHFGVYDSETFKIAPSRYCGPEMPYGGDINPLNYLPTIPSSQIAPGSGGLQPGE